MDEKMKSSEQQVLLMTDAAEPKALKAVTGLDKNGKLKTVNPDGADMADLFAIDKNGNALENFFKKFLEQYKNPSHTGFYLMTKDLLDKIIKIQPIDERMLEPYRVDPQQYLFAVQEQQGKAQEQNVETPTQKNGFQPIDESKINWQQVESLGVNRQMLEETGQLKAMLYGHKSPGLVQLDADIEGIKLDPKARLSFKEMPDGTYNLQPHCHQVSLDLDKPFLGATLTDKDKENLLKSGNAGRVIELEPVPGQKVPALVSVDKMTNRLEAVPIEKLNIPQSLKGVEFTPEQLNGLKEGKPVLVEGMTTKKSLDTDNPKKFDAYIQFNAAKGSFDFNYEGLNNNRYRQENVELNNEKALLSIISEKGINGLDDPQFAHLTETEKDAFLEKNQLQPLIKEYATAHHERQTEMLADNYDTMKKLGQYMEKLDEDVKAQAKTALAGEQNNVRIPSKLLGVELTQKQQEALREDKTIYVKGMVKDGQDQPFNAYIKVNHEEGKLNFYRYNPDKAKKQGAEVTPANESKTQVAVNSEGKTNEATKHVKEPLKQTQTRPDGNQQKQIKKSKGVKM